MKHIKNFKLFNESLNNSYSGRYLELEALPNGLKISLTPEAKEELEEILPEEKIHDDDISDMFDDIQGNSEYLFHLDMGIVGFGLTEAPGITDGYQINDDYTEYELIGDTAEVYYYGDYMIKSFKKELKNNGYVIFDKA